MFGIAALAFRRSRGRAAPLGAEGELESWAAGPACGSVLRTDGWSREQRDTIASLVDEEIKRAQASQVAGLKLANPRTVANRFVKMISPECPENPPPESAIYPWWVDAAELAQSYMLQSLPSSSIAMMGTGVF